MLDQLIIGEKKSYDDFSASVAERTITPPKKKSIKEKVPFSNVTHDFSAINGELYWEEAELKYVFEITAETPEELENLKSAFSAWVMNVMNESIHDPFIKNYHYVGTYEEMDFEDDEGQEKTKATVTFMAYPYKIADEPDTYKATIAVGGKETLIVDNGSNHRLTPTITVEGNVSIKKDNVTYTAASGTFTDEKIKMAVGSNTFEIENIGDEACSVTISFYKEVF